VTRDETVYEELEDLEGDLVQIATEASLWNTSMIGSIGAQPTIGGEPHTDSLIERSQDTQRLPQS